MRGVCGVGPLCIHAVKEHFFFKIVHLATVNDISRPNWDVKIKCDELSLSVLNLKFCVGSDEKEAGRRG